MSGEGIPALERGDLAGELVIEWPDPRHEYRRPVLGKLAAVYEFRVGYGLRMLENVTAVTVHAIASDVVTADVTAIRPAGADEEPTVDVSTWLVVGFRLRGSA